MNNKNQGNRSSYDRLPKMVARIVWNICIFKLLSCHLDFWSLRALLREEPEPAKQRSAGLHRITETALIPRTETSFMTRVIFSYLKFWLETVSNKGRTEMKD